MIEKGNLVSVNYTGKFTETGEVFDTSEGKDVLKFQVGSGQIIAGFENALIGKEKGEKLVVDINPEDGYGEIREDLIVEVKKDQMPGEVEAGQTLQAESENGQQVNVVVKEVTNEKVIVDGNHPLAGKKLTFDIEIVEIETVG
jgi:peptidylprolyl isomerase